MKNGNPLEALSQGDADQSLLLAVANGFPPQAYLKILHSLDQPGLAITASLPRPLWPEPGPHLELDSWSRFRDELLVSIRASGERFRPWIGIGHSLGAQTLLAAALKDPGAFEGLILLDPTLLSIGKSWFFRILKASRRFGLKPRIPLIELTRSRRFQFKDLDEARAHLLQKEAYAKWDPEILQAYLRHGFSRNAGNGLYELRWSREWEARVYETTPTEHWETLQLARPKLRIPILVLSGGESDVFTGSSQRMMRWLLPHADYATIESGGHLFPFTHPGETARVIRDWIRTRMRPPAAAP